MTRIDSTDPPPSVGSSVAAPPGNVGEPDLTVRGPTGRRYLRLVVVLGAMIAIGPLTIDTYLPALPAISRDLAAGDAATQLTLTGMLGGLAFGQLVVGPLSDALGRRRPLILGLVLHVVASLLCAVSPGIVVLTTVRVLQGFAGAAISVVALAVVRDLFEGVAVARLISRLMLVIGLAPILAPSLGGLVLGWTSWRGIFVFLALAGALLLVVALSALPETLPAGRRRPPRLADTMATYRRLVTDPPFVALVLIGGLMMSAIFAYVSGASFVLQDGYGLDAQEFGLVFGANAVGLTVTSQLNPLMLRRFAPHEILTVAMLVAMVAAAVLVVAGATGVGGLAAVLLSLAVVVASAGLALPNTPALALNRHGEAAGTASAMLGFAQFGVGAVIAPVVGVFGSTAAWPMGLVMLAVTLLATTLMFGVVRRDAALTAGG